MVNIKEYNNILKEKEKNKNNIILRIIIIKIITLMFTYYTHTPVISILYWYTL